MKMFFWSSQWSINYCATLERIDEMNCSQLARLQTNTKCTEFLEILLAPILEGVTFYNRDSSLRLVSSWCKFIHCNILRFKARINYNYKLRCFMDKFFH